MTKSKTERKRNDRHRPFRTSVSPALDVFIALLLVCWASLDARSQEGDDRVWKSNRQIPIDFERAIILPPPDVDEQDNPTVPVENGPRPSQRPSRSQTVFPFRPSSPTTPTADTTKRAGDQEGRIVNAMSKRQNGELMQASAAPMWWDEHVRGALLSRQEPLPLEIVSLAENALRYSSYVQVLTAEPHVYECELVMQTAKFDWRNFVASTYADRNDPVGSKLTTGNNASRFLDQTSSLDAGVRRNMVTGGNVKAYQRFGTQANNSTFLFPNGQRTTRLELQLTQPLLRGAGRAYNESQIVLARLRADQSSDEVAGEIESHLVKVSEAYWGLYRARAELVQRRKLLSAAADILANLEGRREVDALERQILRARSAVAARKSEIDRVAATIRNLESQLRLLVNAPTLLDNRGREFAPAEAPFAKKLDFDMSESLHTALINRPDISRSIRIVRAAAVELKVAEKDVLPSLDLIASGYVAGLSAGQDPGQAFVSQFSQGRPGYALGFQFEAPFDNRGAKADVERRKWQWSRAVSQYRLAIEEGLTKVEIAIREVETCYQELGAKIDSLQAVEREAAYLTDRWQVLPGTGDSASLLLDDLLDAQGRVANEEGNVARAQVEYALAIVQLKREMGTLLKACDP